MTTERTESRAHESRLARAHVLRYAKSVPPLDLVAGFLDAGMAPVYVGWTTPRDVVVAWAKYVRAGPTFVAKIPGAPAEIREYNACDDPERLVERAVKTVGHPPRPGRGHRSVCIIDLWNLMNPEPAVEDGPTRGSHSPRS